MGPDYTYLPGFSKKLPDGPAPGAILESKPMELSDTEIRSDAIRYAVESFGTNRIASERAILKRARIFEDYIRNG